ncbi:MAG: glycerophosphodiester phosphodiesterase [Elusimicrobiota bacterium]
MRPLLGCLLSLGLAVQAAETVAPSPSRRIEVHGHRGARAVLPENTLAAFAEALRVGVDVLELDLVATKDDVLVVSHDQEVNRTLCLGPGGKKVRGPIPIRSLTVNEVQSYDCGSLKNPRFPKQKPVPGERIPTLDEVFRMVLGSEHPAAKTVRFNIETKIVPARPELSPTPGRFAKLVVDAVRKHGLAGKVIVQSFDYRTLAAVKELAPEIKIAVLISENLPDLPAIAEALGAEIISPNHRWITKEEVRRLQEQGVRVVPWTVNEEDDWIRMLEYGVDGIITDDPERLIDFLSKRR